MKYKKGFSLAEVLLALGIISVIVTMGMTISKKGVERAHNLYYYSGYAALNDAISDVTMNDVNNQNDIQNHFGNFGNELRKRFNGATGENSTVDNKQQININTVNGISYYIQCPTEGATCPSSEGYLVTMAVPKINNTANNTMFLYRPNDENYTLYPIDGGTMNLQTRVDIIPFYIDDGLTNKITPSNFVPDSESQSAPDYKRRVFMSFIDAYCDRFGTPVNFQENSVVSCKNSPTKVEGLLKFENPQKVF